MKKTARILSILLAAVLMFSACGTNAGTDEPTASPAGTAAQETAKPQETDKDAAATSGSEPAVLRMSISAGVNTFNPFTAESAIEYMHQQWITANLYKRLYSEEMQSWYWAPELADGEPIDVNGDGKTWHIKMREGFTFEDGTVIDANVVDYTMRLGLDPKLASRNSGIGKTLVNGDDYYLGEVEDWEDVGINVIDDYTVEFIVRDEYIPYDPEELKEGLAHVGAGLVHPEMFESCFNADRTENTYGTNTSRYVAGGAYVVTQYIDGQYMEVTRRESGHPYVEENVFTPDVLQLYVVTDTNTQLQMYLNNEIDITQANQTDYDDHPDVFYLYTPDNYGIFINSESNANPILQNYDFRYAMYWGFDREKIVELVFPTNVANPYHYSYQVTARDPADPSTRLVMRDTPESKAIRFDGNPLTDTGFDEDLALEYFAKAYEANGNKKIEVEMQYSDGDEVRKSWAEAVQFHFNDLFGADRFNMSLRGVPHATIYENMSRHGHETGEMPFDMSCTAGIYSNIVTPWANSNWVYSGPDVYSSQYTLLGKEASEEWDELYYECSMGDYKQQWQEQIEASARMEEILYNESTFIPAYTRGNRFLIADHIDILMETNIGCPFTEFALMQARYN